ncbi:MAG: hypothetical protein KatS3mg053_2740 [Candidatus Roseilinea sp.]|jgi:hypothetical protein|uniref:DUF1905 domain-containing protein n=1 Tax=Candidatus Roseilinea sp. NK_OTU-006 TaxID=2704250 RepID=UPI00145C6C69|nr:DUF1905 domain-containing protein [Candidatus Roseilinea sp. NK_OTU-006]BCX04802.1 MAG: hypothetical protein KatS3mg053_2740 [Candidatus Roseilinea sp.]
MQLHLEFSGRVFHWRGPAPHYFIAVPEHESQDLKAIQKAVTYGWGVIPARVRIGETAFTTSLFPKDGRFLVPIKNSVRKAEQLREGDVVTIRLEVG